MRRGRGLALLAATLFASGITASIFDSASICSAQTFTGSDVSDTLIISASTSTTWQDGGENVAQVDGGVSIKLDRVELRGSCRDLAVAGGRRASRRAAGEDRAARAF